MLVPFLGTGDFITQPNSQMFTLGFWCHDLCFRVILSMNSKPRAEMWLYTFSHKKVLVFPWSAWLLCLPAWTPLPERLRLKCSELELRPAPKSLAGPCEHKPAPLKPANLSLLHFLLGLHNFNDQEVKHPFKQSQSLVLDFQIQF